MSFGSAPFQRDFGPGFTPIFGYTLAALSTHRVSIHWRMRMSNPQKADATTPTFNEFPPTPYEEWRKAVDKALKGAPFEKRLITKTYEEIDLQPMYQHEDIEGLPHLDRLPGFAP
jgi:hypothetical protein